MTTTFIKFTETRKAQIDHMRTRLMTLRPYKQVYATIYVTWLHPLSLVDYVVYAALRGADYRKGDHTGGKVATALLKQVVRTLDYWITSDAHINKTKLEQYLPGDSTDDQILEMKEVLEAELVKWSSAQ